MALRQMMTTAQVARLFGAETPAEDVADRRIWPN